MPPNKILVCTTCNGQSASSIDDASGSSFGNLIDQAVKEANLSEEFSVGYIDCMGACTEPVSVAIQGTEKATYLFSGLDPHTDVGDIVETCRTYLASADGWITDARACGRLRHCLKARVPAFKAG